jgi:hypothetical protein
MLENNSQTNGFDAQGEQYLDTLAEGRVESN